MSARSIHPFPARMAPEIALDVIPSFEDSTQLTIIDPMCGSGTVLSAAINRGHRAVGVDIDPLAVLMSTVATTPLRGSDVEEQARLTIDLARSEEGQAPWKDGETEKFVNFWFGPEQKRDLIALTSAIDSVDDKAVKAALQVAVSRIIITKAPHASLAADTSHSRPHRVLTSSEYDVFDGFRRSTRTLSRLLDARQATGQATVKIGDSRVLEGIEDRSMDIAVTSPPYLNALDYMRGHKMALVWFGHSVTQLRNLRSSSIGAERRPDDRPSEQILDLVDFIKKDVTDPEKLPVGMLQRFAGDMVGFASAISRVLKDDGEAALVVGNSTLRGNYIRNDLIAQKALENAGFAMSSRQEREIPSTNRYMAISTKNAGSTIQNRMKFEVVMRMHLAQRKEIESAVRSK